MEIMTAEFVISIHSLLSEPLPHNIIISAFHLQLLVLHPFVQSWICKLTMSEIITCKAAVCWGLGEPLKIEEIQVEPPRPMEARIKMLCSSLCHTDIMFWKEVAYAKFPRVLGHEGVGVVESIGEGVTEVKEGDFVIPTFLGECKECTNCTSGKSNICYKYTTNVGGLMPDNTSRMSINGQILYHIFTCAAWSEYTVVNVNYLVKVSSKLSLNQASILSCGFTTGYGAAWKEAKVEKGSSIAVFGLGAVGLGVIDGARMRGATKIIGVDINEWKMDKGMEFGMTDFINPNKFDKSISDTIKEMTNGLGVDYSFECTGAVPLISQALESTTMGRGISIIIGSSKEMYVPINVFQLMGGRTIKGSSFGGIKPQSDFSYIEEKCLNKEVILDTLVTHEIQLDDINKAFELSKQPDCIKVVIQINKA